MSVSYQLTVVLQAHPRRDLSWPPVRARGKRLEQYRQEIKDCVKCKRDD